MTTIAAKDIRQMFNDSDLNTVADTLKRIKFGNMASKIKVVVTGLSAAAAIDVTTAAVKAAAAITGITLESGENLPPIGTVHSLRVTASGTATSVGVYTAADPAATLLIPPGGANAAVGVARLSDDNKTLTFPNTITAFTLVYSPAPAVALNTEWPATAP
jgi:hypothetical protein